MKNSRPICKSYVSSLRVKSNIFRSFAPETNKIEISGHGEKFEQRDCYNCFRGFHWHLLKNFLEKKCFWLIHVGIWLWNFGFFIYNMLTDLPKVYSTCPMKLFKNVFLQKFHKRQIWLDFGPRNIGNLSKNFRQVCENCIQCATKNIWREKLWKLVNFSNFLVFRVIVLNFEQKKVSSQKNSSGLSKLHSTSQEKGFGKNIVRNKYEVICFHGQYAKQFPKLVQPQSLKCPLRFQGNLFEGKCFFCKILNF